MFYHWYLIIDLIKYIFKNNFFLIKYSSLLTLLYISTKGKVEISSDEDKDIEINLISNFQSAKVPLVITKESLDVPMHYQFYIQMLIIIEFYSSKINKTIG
mgnify:FL=1